MIEPYDHALAKVYCGQSEMLIANVISERPQHGAVGLVGLLSYSRSSKVSRRRLRPASSNVRENTWQAPIFVLEFPELRGKQLNFDSPYS